MNSLDRKLKRGALLSCTVLLGHISWSDVQLIIAVPFLVAGLVLSVVMFVSAIRCALQRRPS